MLVATGTHRASTAGERPTMLGAEVLDVGASSITTRAIAAASSDLGTVDDVPVLLNREWVEADVRITTGFVEPHFFAGFSGGPKMVAPGLAGPRHRPRAPQRPRGSAIRARPGASSRATPSTTRSGRSPPRPASTSHWTCCSTTGSGSRERSAARSSRCTPLRARPPARRRCARSTGRSTSSITTNSGYPLDQNLYQAVKGMSAAADGRPRGRHDHLRRRMPRRPAGPRLVRGAARIGATRRRALAQILASPDTIPDQWQVQIQARVQAKARVLVKADGLSDAAGPCRPPRADRRCERDARVGSSPRSPRRGSASCLRDPRRFRTSRCPKRGAGVTRRRRPSRSRPPVAPAKGLGFLRRSRVLWPT